MIKLIVGKLKYFIQRVFHPKISKAVAVIANNKKLIEQKHKKAVEDFMNNEITNETFES